MKMVQLIMEDQLEKAKDKYRYRTKSLRQVNVDFLREELKETNLSKANWIELGNVRGLYPHLLVK